MSHSTGIWGGRSVLVVLVWCISTQGVRDSRSLTFSFGWELGTCYCLLSGNCFLACFLKFLRLCLQNWGADESWWVQLNWLLLCSVDFPVPQNIKSITKSHIVLSNVVKMWCQYATMLCIKAWGIPIVEMQINLVFCKRHMSIYSICRCHLRSLGPIPTLSIPPLPPTHTHHTSRLCILSHI